jgi:Pentose-5-phosphate-3-epimerase
MSWHEWVRNAEVEPSLYAADFARLGDQIETLLAAGCRIFHFDVGDGHFVEPVTIGPVVLDSDRPARP